LFALSLFCFSGLLSAQDSIPFSSPDQKVIAERWSRLQPFADVVLNNGDTLKGQPLNFDRDTLAIYPSTSLPYNMVGVRYIPLSEIDRVVLNRGGRSTMALTTGITVGIVAGIAAGFAISGPVAALILGNVGGGGLGLIAKNTHNALTFAELDLKSYNLDYNKELVKLQKWSVFEDSLVLTNNMLELPHQSKAIRSVFQPKHFRISFALNGGFNGGLEEDIRNMIESTGLPLPNDYWRTAMGFEFLDFAWRFNNRWIIGGGLMINRENLVSANYYNYNYNYEEAGVQDYTFSLRLKDWRVYTEYAFWPVDWFPARRTEILLGAGFIVSRPDTYFYGSYLSDTITYEDGYFDVSEKYTVFGAQLRASFHVYVAQTVSFSVGMEGNLYQNLEIPSVDLSGSNPEIPIELPEFSLNYSTVRLKVGVHISF
jgi:hypothetical protein